MAFPDIIAQLAYTVENLGTPLMAVDLNRTKNTLSRNTNCNRIPAVNFYFLTRKSDVKLIAVFCAKRVHFHETQLQKQFAQKI